MSYSQFKVTSEIGQLRRVLIHSPDEGIGVVIPTKAQEWLYEDIVSLREMQEQYDTFKKLLFAYLDPDLLKKWFAYELANVDLPGRPKVAVPGSKEFLRSDKVVEAEDVLAAMLHNRDVRTRLVSSICAIERVDHVAEQALLDPDTISSSELARILITGVVRKGKIGDRTRYLFPPVPNFVFTRDIGIVLNEHLLLSRTANPARLRESIIIKYLAFYHLLSDQQERIIEIKDDEQWFLYGEDEQRAQAVSIEGGDVMMIHDRHILIGCSERTSEHAIDKFIDELFGRKDIGIEKISVVMIPQQRSTMHIDTVFTQVARDTWVVYPDFLNHGGDRSLASQRGVTRRTKTPAWVIQYTNKQDELGSYVVNEGVSSLGDLLYDVSCKDFGCKKKEVNLIYCGNGEFPFSEREQWTDACNVVALKEGVVVGYDLNKVTIECFKQTGFSPIHVTDVLSHLKQAYEKNASVNFDELLDQFVGNRALILLPSSELSRARGGSHCMTMPLLRDPVEN